VDAAAEEEFAREIRWYEPESPGLGNDLWTEIQHGVSLIAEHPLIGNVVPRTRVLIAREITLGRE
jgi:plasmid stabilization system protein ParE